MLQAKEIGVKTDPISEKQQKLHPCSLPIAITFQLKTPRKVSQKQLLLDMFTEENNLLTDRIRTYR